MTATKSLSALMVACAITGTAAADDNYRADDRCRIVETRSTWQRAAQRRAEFERARHRAQARRRAEARRRAHHAYAVVRRAPARHYHVAPRRHIAHLHRTRHARRVIIDRGRFRLHHSRRFHR